MNRMLLICSSLHESRDTIQLDEHASRCMEQNSGIDVAIAWKQTVASARYSNFSQGWLQPSAKHASNKHFKLLVEVWPRCADFATTVPRGHAPQHSKYHEHVQL